MRHQRRLEPSQPVALANDLFLMHLEQDAAVRRILAALIEGRDAAILYTCMYRTYTHNQSTIYAVCVPTVRTDIDRVHTVRTEPEQDFPILDCADY